jgi:hypothetical protein
MALAAATVAEASSARSVLGHEDDILGFAPCAVVGDVEADNGIGAPSDRPLPVGEAGSQDGQALALLGLDETEVFDLVEPNHRSSHRLPFAG